MLPAGLLKHLLNYRHSLEAHLATQWVPSTLYPAKFRHPVLHTVNFIPGSVYIEAKSKVHPPPTDASFSHGVGAERKSVLPHVVLS